MRPANERQRLNETSPLIGWVHSQNAVYDFKYFQGLPFGLFEFEDL